MRILSNYRVAEFSGELEAGGGWIEVIYIDWPGPSVHGCPLASGLLASAWAGVADLAGHRVPETLDTDVAGAEDRLDGRQWVLTRAACLYEGQGGKVELRYELLDATAGGTYRVTGKNLLATGPAD